MCNNNLMPQEEFDRRINLQLQKIAARLTIPNSEETHKELDCQCLFFAKPKRTVQSMQKDKREYLFAMIEKKKQSARAEKQSLFGTGPNINMRNIPKPADDYLYSRATVERSGRPTLRKEVPASQAEFNRKISTQITARKFQSGCQWNTMRRQDDNVRINLFSKDNPNNHRNEWKLNRRLQNM